MVNSLDHTEDVGGILLHHGMVHFVNAERIESSLLDFRGVDTAFNLSDWVLKNL